MPRRDQFWCSRVPIGFRRLLSDKNWAQADLIRALGNPQRQQQINRYINGRVCPTQRTVRNICKKLNVPFERYFSSSAEQVPNENESLKAKYDFERAELVRRTEFLYDFARYESRKNQIFNLKNAPMMCEYIKINGKDVELPIPVVVLSRAKRIELAPLPDNIKGESDDHAESSDYISRIKSYNLLKNRNNPSVLNNLRTYTISEIENHGQKCLIKGGVSDYFSMLSQHDSLEFELLSNIWENEQKNSNFDMFYSKLKKRIAFRERDITARRKYAAIGISVLLVQKKIDGNFKILIQRRGTDVAVYRELMHVIPSGMFQPEVDYIKEWSIQNCIIKEFSEELYSEEFSKSARDPFYFYEEWDSARRLYQGLQDGTAKLLHAGVILNLLNLRPQICCVLLIDKSKFKAFQTNWEYMTRREMLLKQLKSIADYDYEVFPQQFIDEAVNLGDRFGHAISGRWIPDGLATLCVQERYSPDTRCSMRAQAAS